LQEGEGSTSKVTPEQTTPQSGTTIEKVQEVQREIWIKELKTTNW
jgi:hypothetical protein